VNLQVADQRPALTLAIALAREEGDPQLSQWEDDLARMVAEITRKFHASLTMEGVRQGLATTIGILDLGLYHASDGAVDPALFLATLRRDGVKGLSKAGIDLAKMCASLPATDFFPLRGEPVPEGDSARDLLLAAIHGGGGYPSLMTKIRQRRQVRREIELAQWMLVHSSVGRVIQRNVEGTVGELPTAEDLHWYVLTREAGIPERRLPKELERLIHLPPKVWSEAKERYDAFVARIPPGLQGGLLYRGESWFERFVLRAEPAKKQVAASTPENVAPLR